MYNNVHTLSEHVDLQAIYFISVLMFKNCQISATNIKCTFFNDLRIIGLSVLGLNIRCMLLMWPYMKGGFDG